MKTEDEDWTGGNCDFLGSLSCQSQKVLLHYILKCAAGPESAVTHCHVTCDEMSRKV